MNLKFPESAWESPLTQMWRDHVAAHSEAPEAFHWVALYMSVALGVGHRAAFRYWSRLYALPFAALLAGTGDKKSSTLSPAARLQREIAGDAVTVYGASTAEGLIAIAAKEEGTVLSIIENEMVNLLVKAQTKNSTLLPQLCRMYDAPEQIDLPTKTEPVIAVRPLVGLIAATTVAGIEERIGEAEQYGGFLNRFMFFSGERRPPNPWPAQPTGETWSDIVRLAEGVVSSYQSVTELEMVDPAVRRLWETYYGDLYKRRGRLPELLAALTMRQDVHVLKLAMYFCILRGDREIGVDDLERAIEVGEYLFAVVEAVVEPLGQNPTNKLEAKIERHLSECAMTRRELHQKVSGRVKSRDLSMALESLIDMQRVMELDGGMLAWTDADYFSRFSKGAA